MDRKIPVLFKEKKECCGCTACYAICSQMAISMIEDEEGFAELDGWNAESDAAMLL